MAEQSPSSKDSQVRLADATPLATSNERTNERTTDASDDCAIPELSDVRTRVRDFNKWVAAIAGRAMAPAGLRELLQPTVRFHTKPEHEESAK